MVSRREFLSEVADTNAQALIGALILDETARFGSLTSSADEEAAPAALAAIRQVVHERARLVERAEKGDDKALQCLQLLIEAGA